MIITVIIIAFRRFCGRQPWYIPNTIPCQLRPSIGVLVVDLTDVEFHKYLLALEVHATVSGTVYACPSQVEIIAKG